MARLVLFLLGSFQVSLDGTPVTAFQTDKARALLAYLAVEADHPHRREALAALLWPDHPDSVARSSLRQALYSVRRALADRNPDTPFLLVTPDSIQLNPEADCWLDTAEFERLTSRLFAGPPVTDSRSAICDLEAAIALYRGDFLAGISLGGSAGFEEWALYRQEHYHRLALEALVRLTVYYERAGEYDRAAGHARRQIELEPWREEAHRQLMRVLALAGQRGAALRQYETCRRLLVEELGVEPSPDTTALHEAIGRGELATEGIQAGRAAPVDENLAIAFPGAGLPFVERAAELAALERALLLALAGHGRATFVTGEAGIGKTTLLHEFARRARAAHGNLMVARGRCNAQAGVGDPYLPFREILAALALPFESLVNAPAPGQAALFQQVTGALMALAGRHPLLLLVDDLQWADDGSVGLLFHLGRRLEGSRILLLGAYRRADLVSEHTGERHPLHAVVHELEHDFGEASVDLMRADGRRFVEAYLDTEPNRLGARFREILYRHTNGNPLFTIELLRGLQERGDIRRDRAGRWVEGPDLDWDRLPTRVEAVIAERVGRLPEQCREALAVASVEGEEFTAEVVAHVRGVGVAQAIGCLSGSLGEQHRLVQAEGVRHLDGTALSRYRFRHFLFHKYVYHSLDPVRRARLHEATGRALEDLYGPYPAELAALAPQLARHFEQAGLAETAAGYLLQAGEWAAHFSAHEEAIPFYRRGLALLETLPESPQRARLELDLQLALCAPLGLVRSFLSPERAQALTRALELAEHPALRDSPQRRAALMCAAANAAWTLDHERAGQFAGQLLSLAQEAGDSALLIQAHWVHAQDASFRGEVVLGQEHVEQALALYDPDQHRSLGSLFGYDLGIALRAMQAMGLWVLGYPERARQYVRQTLAEAGRVQAGGMVAEARAELGMAFCLMFRDIAAARDQAQALRQGTGDILLFGAWADVLAGYALVEAGDEVAAGLAQMRQGVTTWTTVGPEVMRAPLLVLLAQACSWAGRVDEGLAAIDGALARYDRTGGMLAAEAYRLRGELLARGEAQGAGYASPGREAEAEACFRRAIEVARRQRARSWELRATTSLYQLLKDRPGGSPEELAGAQAMLAEIFDWFTEGFDTPDLRAAGALLAQI